MNIEPLESRIAPAAIVVNNTTATWFDVDGDFVTMKISKPVMASIGFSSTAVGLISDQVTLIDLTDPACEGISITITAKPSDPGDSGTKFGDGFVNIGTISALTRHLGSISIHGDLGQIVVGNGTGTALKSLSVQSIFAFGTTTGATNYISDIQGSLGTLKIAGDLNGGYVRIGAGGNLDSATIGGSLLGSSAGTSGAIYAEGDLGPVVVKGSVVGGRGAFSASIGAGKNVGSVTVLGSLLGGPGDDSGSIYSGFLPGGGDMGAIKIGHDVRGGSGTLTQSAEDTGVIASPGNIASVTIGGSLLQGGGSGQSGRISAGGDVGAIKIGGSVDGGVILVGDSLKSLAIGGSLLGTGSDASGVVSATNVGTVSIRGDVAGGFGTDSGSLDFGAAGSVTIGGALIGGNDFDIFDGVAQGAASGQITVGRIATLKIGLGVHGGSGLSSGSVEVTNSIAVTSLTLGGSLVGGPGVSSGSLYFAGKLAKATILGDVRGEVSHTGEIIADGDIGSLTIAGSLVGGDSGQFSGVIRTNGVLGSLKLGGDLSGGDGHPNGNPTTDLGTIQARRIGSIAIGGSITGGTALDTNSPPVRSGSIHAVEDIGSITVKGSIIGNAQVPVFITASGQANPTATIDLAIKNISVAGSTSFARILAGYDKTLMASNGDAQIGTIKVGGDWTAGYVIAGVNPVDGLVGNGNDITLDPGVTGPTAKIAAIIIGGQVRGQPGTNNVFGFGAEQIVSFKMGGVNVPLKPGRTTDLFAGGNAPALGSSLSNLNTDGRAVHVFEV